MTADGRLHLSQDRKVSPKGYNAGTDRRGRERGHVASLANSLGLPAGHTCPGATPFCRSCYAINAERYRTAVEEAMHRNLDLLLAARTINGMYLLLCEALDRYRAAFDRTGLPERDRVFRIHWDGDFYSLDYAAAWASAIAHNPDVHFWTYTRSFVDPVNVVPILAGLDNLALYLSVDAHNQAAALDILDYHLDVRLALCATDYNQARQLAPDHDSHICPENAGRLPLMDSNGRGACVECRWCIVGKRNVLFSTSHVEDAEDGQGLLFGAATAAPPVTVPVAIRPRATS